jgi:hypothetical protein
VRLKAGHAIQRLKRPAVEIPLVGRQQILSNILQVERGLNVVCWILHIVRSIVFLASRSHHITIEQNALDMIGRVLNGRFLLICVYIRRGLGYQRLVRFGVESGEPRAA